LFFYLKKYLAQLGMKLAQARDARGLLFAVRHGHIKAQAGAHLERERVTLPPRNATGCKKILKAKKKKRRQEKLKMQEKERGWKQEESNVALCSHLNVMRKVKQLG
jgi:hypothetical protein